MHLLDGTDSSILFFHPMVDTSSLCIISNGAIATTLTIRTQISAIVPNSCNVTRDVLLANVNCLIIALYVLL